MAESTQFLESLRHDNLDRPRFAIKREVYDSLEIDFRGQVMCISMAEVLAFARRWEADQAAQRASRKETLTLAVFPYPLMRSDLDDPDLKNLRWWPEP